MSSETEGGNDRERGRERDRGERTYLLVAMLSYLIPSQRHLFSVHFPIQLLVTSIFAGSLLYYLRFIALQQGPRSPTVHIGHMVGQLLVFPDFQCVCFLGGLGAWTCYWSCPGADNVAIPGMHAFVFAGDSPQQPHPFSHSKKLSIRT